MSRVLGHASKRWPTHQRCHFSACRTQRARGGRAALKANPTGPARTRFAPSPTGYLHLGSLRTALFNYLLAKSTGGQFLLRVEDTDQKRTLPDAEQRLCQDLGWAGLQWDEGPEVGGPYGPYQQSKRTALYRESAGQLLKSGHAYRCFCTSRRLHELAEYRNKLGLPVDYDRACFGIPSEESEDRAHKGEPYVVRLKVPDRYPDFHDLVYGKVSQAPVKTQPQRHGEPAYEDPILLKSDGLPTYHLANVVDDHHMQITHVVRAAEWMSSTPKHLAMYEAFQWQPPAFAHVGLLQNIDGQKLSKRNFDQDISYFRDTLGILPEALNNYVALLGWSHGKRNDIFTLKQLVENFGVNFTKGNAIVTEAKLNFLQKAHARLRAEEGGPKFEEMVDRVYSSAQELHLSPDNEPLASILRGRDMRSYIAEILRADIKNFVNSAKFLDDSVYFFEHPTVTSYSPVAADGAPVCTVPAKDLAAAASQLEEVSLQSWTSQDLKQHILDINNAFADKSEPSSTTSAELTERPSDSVGSRKKWNKAFHHYLRWALAGGKQGPAVSDTMIILGRDESLDRLKAAAECVNTADSSQRHG